MGGVESPMGTDTPGAKELPQRYKTSGVTFEGNGVPGGDGLGQVGDENSPGTRRPQAPGPGREKTLGEVDQGRRCSCVTGGLDSE